MIRQPPRPTLFPSTPLSRSQPPSKLNTPRPLHPCSSSPISLRSGSLDSVVLPVPDRPKNSAASPRAPMFAEQCIGRSEEHTSELQSQSNLVCRLLLEKKNTS